MIRSSIGASVDWRSESNSERRLKIAILLPASPHLRTIRRAAELAAALIEAHSAEGHAVEVTVGVAEHDESKWRAAERQIRSRAPGTIVRHLEWTRVSVKNARRMFSNLPPFLDMEGLSEVTVPRDWGWNFQDCDLWISMANPDIGAILPLRPTAQYCSELAQRYVPTAITGSIHDAYWTNETEAFRLWRQGLVITSDPDTAVDLVSYAGVRRERIEIVPDLLDDLAPITPVAEEQRDPMLLLWLLRGNALDDLENSLQALTTYYREGGRFELLLAHDARAPVEHHLGAATLPPDLLEFYKELPKFACRSVGELERMLPRAGAVWSSMIAGGEAEHVHDAARSCSILLAPRFPLNERAVDRLGARAILYQRDDPLALADALRQLEEATISAPRPIKAGTLTGAGERRAAWGFLIDRMLEHSYAL